MRRTGLMAGNARIGKPWSAPLFSVEQVQKNTYTAKEILVLLTKKDSIIFCIQSLVHLYIPSTGYQKFLKC